MMQLLGIMEVCISFVCLAYIQKDRRKVLLLIAWFATSLLAYRFGLWLMGWKEPCNCMGYLTTVFHISPRTADEIMKVALGYMLLFSYALLVCLYLDGKERSIKLFQAKWTNRGHKDT